MKTQKQKVDDVEIKHTEYKTLNEKEYKAHLKEVGIDNDTIKSIWERIERGRK